MMAIPDLGEVQCHINALHLRQPGNIATNNDAIKLTKK
jgi:hypothetical protein